MTQTVYAFIVGAIVAFSVLIMLADEVTEDGLVFYSYSKSGLETTE